MPKVWQDRMLGLPWGGQTATWYAERLRRAGKPVE